MSLCSLKVEDYINFSCFSCDDRKFTTHAQLLKHRREVHPDTCNVLVDVLAKL